MNWLEFNDKYLLGRSVENLGYVSFLVPRIIPKIVCNDGFEVSVQVGASHYCTPRENHGPWTHVELGFPNMVDDSLLEYAEMPDIPTETVYGWVPVMDLMEIFEEHGGIDEERTKTWRD